MPPSAELAGSNHMQARTTAGGGAQQLHLPSDCCRCQGGLSWLPYLMLTVTGLLLSTCFSLSCME